MSEKTINEITEQFTKAFEPARAFAGLTLDHVEQLTRIQIEAARAYTDLGISQVREALQISDVKSLQDYAAKQKDVAETVTKRVQEDAQKLGEIGQSYTQEAAKLAERNVAELQNVAQPARRKAPAKSRGGSSNTSAA